MPRSKTQGSLPLTLALLIAVSLFFSGCGKITSWIPGKASVEKAEAMAVQGRYSEAVDLYESLLDGTAATADIHRRLAVIYDAKLKDSISALHHYRRYLVMESGAIPGDVKIAAARLERDLGRKNAPPAAVAPKVAPIDPPVIGKTPLPVDAKGFSTVPKTAKAEQLVGAETKTYKVQKGDTIAAISRKFYKTPDRWKDIVDANFNQLNGSPNIREGQTLIIP